MRSLINVLPTATYDALRVQGAEMYKAWKNAPANKLFADQVANFRKSPIVPRGDMNDPRFQERLQAFMDEVESRKAIATDIVKSMVYNRHPELQKDGGVTTNLGYNFYDLRAPVMLLYPVNVPMRNMLPRVGPVNAGVGTMANWKATRNVGSSYAGVSEGKRSGRSTPDENEYYAKYKEIGVERGVTFTAQFAGEGYADNIADEHIRGLHSLWLQEEGLIWCGNSGNSTGNTGFKLGRPSQPTGAVATTHTVGTAGSGPDLPYTAALTTSNYVSVAVVFMSAMGHPNNTQYGYGAGHAIATGLVPSFSRTNADASSDTIAGGISKVSVISAPVQATSGHLTIRFDVAAADKPVKGCFGYAWFVDVETSNTGSIANAVLAGITTVPYCYVSGTPTGTQTASATGLDADHSYEALDFDGLLSFAAATPGAYWRDLYGASLTSEKNGRVTEIETVLEYMFTNYQTTADEIWCSADAAVALDAAVRYTGTSSTGYQVFTTRDQQNNLLAGFVVAAYQSRYAVNSPTGATAIPIRIHPMLPAGTIYFHLKSNPYPHSRVPFVSGMMVQRDYYSIEWPQVTREWPFGTYVHEVLAMNLPWVPSVLTGIGTFSAS